MKIFLAAGKDDFCALRTLGEVYATLTGLPVRPRITGSEGISICQANNGKTHDRRAGRGGIYFCSGVCARVRNNYWRCWSTMRSSRNVR